MLRNSRTNLLLAAIARLQNSGNYAETPITMVVDGVLITGIITSEEEYYSLELNKTHQRLFEIGVKEPREKFFGENAKDVAEEEIPDHLCQQFVYLKDAFYVFGDKTIPSYGNGGISIQVRLADVSAFNFGSLSISKD